jgi:hypothetical protein
MGLVKYNNITLNIAEIPDGNMVISEKQFNDMVAIGNRYLDINSRLPVGVPIENLGSIVEKGQKYDSTVQELTGHKTKVTELQTKLDGFKDIPQDFKKSEWERLKMKETSDLRQVKVTELKKKVFEKVEKEFKVKAREPDQRFVDKDALEKLDVNSATAVDDLFKILDKALDVQDEFIKSIGGVIPQPEPVGGGGQQQQQQRQTPEDKQPDDIYGFRVKDKVTDQGASLQHL